jgi:hypothetical protein
MIDFALTINPSIDGVSLPPFSSGRLSIFQTLEGGGNPGELLVTEAAEVTLSFGSVSPGPILLFNLDATNFVQWGVATTVYPFRLHPRAASNSRACPAFVTLESGTIYLRANTADCRVLVLGYSK